MKGWKRRRLGLSYAFGTQRRQIRVGKPRELILVIRLCEDAKAGDEIVMTPRDFRSAKFAMEHEW